MSYTLDFEDRGFYLFAHLTGKDSFEASMEYWYAIAAKTNQLGYSKVLVHENLTGHVSEAEIYDIMTSFKDAGFLGIQIAFYDENMADEEINDLGQLIVNNRGADVKIFGSLEEAQRWIERVQ